MQPLQHAHTHKTESTSSPSLLRFKYLWADGVAVKTPIKCSAPEYVDYLLTWVEGQFNDEKLFPTALGTR